MWLTDSQVRIWLCSQPTDMRKSFNGLSGLVRHSLKENPLSGALFVFVNRRRTHIKILYFDGSGYCIWMKRLEQGCFQLPVNDRQTLELDRTILTLMLDGIDLNFIQKRKRFQLKNK
jgi:transposase